ncbi:hypothetical protein EMPG_12348 [Blastomyces silverae]|uniref:Inositol oxygenase n=1 Tax=Blastomyces silverae TaxID=2060906 RepID=A0A0H1BNP1_9EURO|nr:hypothetical protein EMPG_12348 [Blastomyces silverae]
MRPPKAIVSVPLERKDGLALEELSDNIDAVNALNASLIKKEKGLYDESEFDKEKDKSRFRQYELACEKVKQFYLEQHEKQTVAYNIKARNDFRAKTRAHMGIWDAIEKLNTLIDDSDPDTSLTQIEHLLQAAEAIRRDGKPRWMQLTGLIHDLGKLLYFFDAQGQWDVVGDTFPVGCAFDDRIIYTSESFKKNPDYGHEIYGTKYGIYSPGAYMELMDEHDKDMLEAVRAFNPYDLYSKNDDIPNAEELKPYYLELIDEFFPQKIIRW